MTVGVGNCTAKEINLSSTAGAGYPRHAQTNALVGPVSVYNRPAEAESRRFFTRRELVLVQ